MPRSELPFRWRLACPWSWASEPSILEDRTLKIEGAVEGGASLPGLKLGHCPQPPGRPCPSTQPQTRATYWSIRSGAHLGALRVKPKTAWAGDAASSAVHRRCDAGACATTDVLDNRGLARPVSAGRPGRAGHAASTTVERGRSAGADVLSGGAEATSVVASSAWDAGVIVLSAVERCANVRARPVTVGLPVGAAAAPVKADSPSDALDSSAAAVVDGRDRDELSVASFQLLGTLTDVVVVTARARRTLKTARTTIDVCDQRRARIVECCVAIAV